jgi:trans-aconitate 2-methyltransferase
LTPHCRHLDVWETTYWQVLDGDDGIIEWMKGTTLVPYLARSTGSRRALSRGLSRAAARRLSAPCRWVHAFPFKRIFFVAQR